MRNYFGLKLRVGKTILCEIISFNKDDETYAIKDALVFEERQTKDGNLNIAFTPFVLYSDKEEHPIHGDEIYMASPLSEKFIKIYGEALMNFKISVIKSEMYEFLTGNMNEDYIHLLKMIDTCKIVVQEYSERFKGIDTPDFSEMEQKILENRPTIN